MKFILKYDGPFSPRVWKSEKIVYILSAKVSITLSWSLSLKNQGNQRRNRISECCGERLDF